MAQNQNIKTLVDARVHALYCGVTQSGKTTLARHHARLLDAADYDLLIYDPVGTATAGGDWPERAKVFSDQLKFLETLVRTNGENDRPVFAFVDEAADIFGHAHADAQLIPRTIRHQNIYLRLIAQRPKLLPPNVRTQCAMCYMFRLAPDDAKMILADFGHGGDVQKSLDSGDFMLLISGSSSIDEFNCFALVD